MSQNNQLIHHHLHNNNLNSDGSEASSTLSFAKLSKIKSNSIANNLKEADSPSINVVYSSDQDDFLNKSNKNRPKKRNSFILNQTTNHSNNNQEYGASEQEEAEIANQILQLHLKLEEKKKQIELEKQQIDSYYKTQKRDISNEAFLKALKIEKMSNMSNIKENDLNAYEIKESLDSLKKNLPLANQSKSDQYYNDIKSSIDILSTSVVDLMNDLSILEEQKILVKEQKQNLDQLVDQKTKSKNLNNQQINESKFYLHADNENRTQEDDYFDTRSLNQKLMSNSMSDHQLISASLRRSSLQTDAFDKSVDNIILNDNNGMYILAFDLFFSTFLLTYYF